MLEKTYQPADIEARIHAEWMRADAFKAGRPERAAAPPMPSSSRRPTSPARLHMGHALNNTLQDVLCRFERMRGKDVLWQPGTDHAGIATQMVVERQLMERQQPHRREIGREEFVEKVWEWKAESGGTIINQLSRLGASLRLEPRALHDGRGPVARPCRKVFVDLYNDGADLQGQAAGQLGPGVPDRASPTSRSRRARSRASLWHFKYPLAGRRRAIHRRRHHAAGDDAGRHGRRGASRRRALQGADRQARCVLPLVGREIPIVADEYADPEKGSGAVKITPAHDFNDFEVGNARHRARHASTSSTRTARAQRRRCRRSTAASTASTARKRVVADLEALGAASRRSRTTLTRCRTASAATPWSSRG